MSAPWILAENLPAIGGGVVSVVASGDGGPTVCIHERNARKSTDDDKPIVLGREQAQAVWEALGKWLRSEIKLPGRVPLSEEVNL